MQTRMVCPKCGFEQPSTDACLKCGIIISKFKENPATKQERDKIEASLEQSLGRYFTTSVKEDEQAALASFQKINKRYFQLLGITFLSGLIGLALINYSHSNTLFYFGLFLFPGGLIAGIVCAYHIYRCPVCGTSLWLSPEPLSLSGARGIQIHPLPAACPNCNQPLK